MARLLILFYALLLAGLWWWMGTAIVDVYQRAKEVGAEPGTTWAWAVDTWYKVAILYGLIVALPFVIFTLTQKEEGKGEHSGRPWGRLDVGLLSVWAFVILVGDVFLDFVSTKAFEVETEIPENALEIEVIGSMWMWQFKYPNGKFTMAYCPIPDPSQTPGKGCEFSPGADGFYVPAGVPVKLKMHSLDVIHSFFIWPPVSKTQDLYPGRITYQWFKIDKPGDYWVSCREYCGSGHAFMRAKIHVLSKEEWEKWYGGGPTTFNGVDKPNGVAYNNINKN